ncbi:glycosyltransferase family 18 protein [Athelia psychrophila]|uniref:Glycosyltransferase family 18 protein n=1 Tax=Athelia psychrophila TaxID=1759441 RepID=A0A166WCG8_9AGAM|nr:glycosyltransferase family 18 protein [Fibularhizoctonia sp. CBS 109695]
MIRSLFRCIELDNCLPNQNKVVILDSYHFLGAWSGWNSGEDMWARSTISGLRELGYTFLYSKSIDQTVQLYQMFPDLVKAIFSEGDDIYKCWEDEENCLLSESNPYGLPAWKLFAFHFWVTPASPLGRNWTLSPEPYVMDGSPENLYLGYSVEPSCMSQAFIPHDDRNDHIYIMTKDARNIADGYNPAQWPSHFYEAATKATGINFILGASGSNAAESPIPAGVTNHGLLDQKQFIQAVSESLVLVGVGKPETSPTPYEALCLGVPFINPIHSWDEAHPENRQAWDGQHLLLKYMDPPYVYNVFKDDLLGFVEAIEDAIANPIDRYVLERMRLSSIADRLHAILETDWKTRAAELLASKQWIDKSFKL